MRSRGVAPIVGITLLIGIVLVSAIGVFAVGSMAVNAVQSEAEIDNAERSIDQLSHSAQGLRAANGQSAEFAIDGGEDGTTNVDENAGRVQISVGGSKVVDEDLGVLRYEQDGQIIAYQGGGVWKQSGGGTTVVSQAPNFRYVRTAENEATLELPVMTIDGVLSESGDLSGSLHSQGIATVTPGNYNASAIQAGNVSISIESSFCDGWQRFFEAEVGMSIVERCGSDQTIEANVVNNPTKWNTSEGINPIYEYGVFADGNITLGDASGDFNSDLGSSGEIDLSSGWYPVSGETEEDVAVQRDSNDEMIQERLNEVSNPEAFCGGEYDSSCSYDSSDGPVYVDDLNGGEEKVTFDVASGDIDLIIEGDLAVSDKTTWTVEGYESGHSVNVYVTGDIKFGSPTEMGPDDPDHPEAFQIYAKSNAFIDPGSQTEFTGVISAPPGEDSSGTTFANGFYLDMEGVLDVGDIEAQGGRITFDHVPINEDDTPDAIDENVESNRTLIERGDRVHLQITNTELEVKEQ